MVLPKIELRNVAMEMFPADVMERAVDAALEQRERAFHSVAVRAVRLGVFTCPPWRIHLIDGRSCRAYGNASRCATRF